LTKRNAAFLYSDELEHYRYPESCPFKTERAFQLRRTLASMGLLGTASKRIVDFGAAPREKLESVHTPHYLDNLEKFQKVIPDVEALYMGIGGPDTPAFDGMYGYSALAVGASLKGADLILTGEADVAFNPSGGLHHAMPARAAGFCYMNDVAIACKHLVSQGKRVLALDIDVHHGDGTQHVFYESNQVMTISMHENGRYIFPGTGFTHEIGNDAGRGFAVNMPLPPETYNDAFMTCFNDIVVPLVENYAADVIVFELGADALNGDPLAHLKLTNDVYRQVIEFLLSMNTPLLMTGGGGYHIDNTVRAWSLAWCVLTDEHESMDAMNLGLGGVMLESTDWMGGFQDRELPVSDQQRRAVEPEIEKIITALKNTVFPIHGL
jgi:acetoin utilization protein AcuC